MGGFLSSVSYITDHGQLAGLSDDDHTQYLLAAGTRALTGNWLTSSGATEIQFRSSAIRLYSSAANTMDIVATVLNLGVDGDMSFPGGSTLRVMYPIVDGKAQYGKAGNGIADVFMSGQAAKTLAMNRHTTSATAGNNLTVEAGGAFSGGTDLAGGNLILTPGISTGTGISYLVTKGYASANSTGTTDNTKLDFEMGVVHKILANNTATAIANFTLADNSVIAGRIEYSIQVTNGTNVQVEEGLVSFHVTCTNAGTKANNKTLKFGNQQDATSGTLTVSWAITAANPAVLTVNANSSLTPSTGYPRLRYKITNLTSQAMAIQ